MDTIFAPICNLGGSVVSVRFSGKNAFDVLKHFSVKQIITQIHQLFFAKLIHNGKIFDEVVVKTFLEPHSFTGENIVEIDLHANRILLNDFLSIVSEIPNFRFAKNGEFSRRAFLNGKMDIIKSEGINALIRAETRQQQKLANEMFCGNMSKRYQNIRARIIQALSFVETQIDFSEEEVPDNIKHDVENIIVELVNEISTCIEDKKAIDKINNGISVAIIGKPNVGKSSLLNWLAKRDIAITSSIAGTTRDILSANVDIDGYKVIFFDTAGIRDTTDEIEAEGVKRARNIAENADICLIIIDNDDDILEIHNLRKKYQNPIFVLNKIDLNKNKNYNNIDIDNLIPISVLNSINTDILMEKIRKNVLQIVELGHSPMVINERYELLLKQCMLALENINFETTPIEIIAEELNIARDKIGQITGQVYTDDILDNIFSKFCIGK